MVGGIGVSLSVLSAEAGSATGAYLFAYACFLDRWGWLRGGLALWPYAVVVIGWRLGLGMLLSILPVCAVFPDDRSLFFVAIGGMGLLASLFQRRWDPADGAGVSRFWGASVWILAALHLVISPLSVPLRTQGRSALGVFDGWQNSVASVETTGDRRAYDLAGGAVVSLRGRTRYPSDMYRKEST